MLGGEEALSEVAADNLFRVADSREIGAGVPFEEEVEVCGDLREEIRGRSRDIGGEEACNCGF